MSTGGGWLCWHQPDACFTDASAFFLTSPFPPRRVSGRLRERGRFRRPRPLRRVLGTRVYFIIRTQITYIRNIYTRSKRYITAINNKTYFVIYFIFFFFLLSSSPRNKTYTYYTHVWACVFEVKPSTRYARTTIADEQIKKKKKKKRLPPPL